MAQRRMWGKRKARVAGGTRRSVVQVYRKKSLSSLSVSLREVRELRVSGCVADVGAAAFPL